jgi:cation transporter-like permease
MIDLVLIFVSQLATVLFLGINSKLMRDDNWRGSMVVAWFIALAQLGFVYVIKITEVDVISLYFASALGGSMGIGCSHFVYTKLWNK